MRKRPVEKRLSTPLGIVGVGNQRSTKAKTWIGQKIDVPDIGDQTVEDGGRRLRTGKLDDNHIADKIA